MLADGISISYLERLKNKLRTQPFTLMIDESNKNYGENYLCIMVKLFDEQIKSIEVKFLNLKECNSSTADAITQLISECFDEYNLPFDNLIQIMSDNASVMRGCYKGAINQIKTKHAKRLIDIGGCSLHHVANAVEHASKHLFKYEETEDFVQDVSAFFSYHDDFASKLKRPSRCPET